MVLHLLDAVEVISPRPLRSNRSVVALDIGVLLRLPRLDVPQSDPQLLGSNLQASTDIF
jgi:hypothetical protein